MRTGIVIALAFATACATAPAAPVSGPQIPLEIRQGLATFVFAPVEEGVSETDVADAVRPLLARAPVCARVPGVWLDGRPRLSSFTVRYDLMRRDWGADVAEAARRRMDALVEMGFLTVTAESDAVSYALTSFGEESLRGSFTGGRPPMFCAPSEQQLVRIVATERGDFPCGTLRVRFEHAADHWPEWARTEAAQQLVADAGLAPGLTSQGSVSLSRRWYARQAKPENFVNGSLGSLCRDPRRDQYQGDDLTLNNASADGASMADVIEETPLAP